MIDMSQVDYKLAHGNTGAQRGRGGYGGARGGGGTGTTGTGTTDTGGTGGTTGGTMATGGLKWEPQTTKQAQWEHSKKFPGAGANVGQEWLRDPSWGGHVIWNKDLGWQDFPTMAEHYAGAGGPVTQEQMMGWGLTPQMGEDWREHYPDRQTKAERGWTPPGRGTLGGDMVGQPVTNEQGYAGGYTMPEPQPFPYPQQWGTASDVMTRFAQGLPTDAGQWWESQQAPFERRIEDQVKQMAEQMGLGGLRYSTPMTGQIADITGRESANLWGGLADRQLGLTEAAKNRGMQAAGGLAGLGQQYLNAPQDWAQQMYGMGAGMTGLGQQGLDRSYQDWMRQTPEGNPWFQQGMGYSGMPSQMTPQQYNPSFMSQLLGGVGNLIPGIGLLKMLQEG